MKVTKHGSTEIVEYNSLNEFYEYCINSPLNETFRWSKLESETEDEKFTGTRSFEEASELFKNGWTEMAQKLAQRIKVKPKQTMLGFKSKSTMSASGYQAIVPMYLNNQPNSMVNKKMVPVKQKVITVNKMVSYPSGTKVDDIFEESVKALQIVEKLEAQGVRINLNILFGSMKKSGTFIVKVRVKSSNEKANLSKMAFPLVHPSMLRRLLFRWIEVYPTVKRDFLYGYGVPISKTYLKTKISKDEYIIPAFVKKEVNCIKDLENI